MRIERAGPWSMIQSKQSPKPLSKPSTAPLVAPPLLETRQMSFLLFLPLPKPDSHRSETQPWWLDSVEEEEKEVVGPPRPPPGLNRYWILLSNEIVLKAHTKVSLSLSLSLCVTFFKAMPHAQYLSHFYQYLSWQFFFFGSMPQYITLLSIFIHYWLTTNNMWHYNLELLNLQLCTVIYILEFHMLNSWDNVRLFMAKWNNLLRYIYLVC